MHYVLPVLAAVVLVAILAVALFWIAFPLGVFISGLCKYGWEAVRGKRPWWVKGDMKRIGDKDPTKNWGPF